MSESIKRNFGLEPECEYYPNKSLLMTFKIELKTRYPKGTILNENLLVLSSSLIDRFLRLFCKHRTITHRVKLM